MDNGKIERVLFLYSKLLNGYIVNKAEEALYFNVNERSIQRDIDDIRNFIDKEGAETGEINNVIYDREKKGYRLEKLYNLRLNNYEILAICKILLDSRAFTKKEMTNMIDRLIECCVPESNRAVINDLIKNEEYNYIELSHKSVFIDKMWDLGKAIRECNYVEIKYHRGTDGTTISRKIKPVAIMFSEFYFYLAAFIEEKEILKEFSVEGDIYPTIYRIDRIKELKVQKDKFRIPYSDRFEEGEFRKRIQFMYGGKLQKVKFKFKGISAESVLDRLPTAKILEEKNGVFTISAEVFGLGIDMWLKSQGDRVFDVEIS